MKCPFCLNESYNVLSLVKVETDDCVRVCVECSNCGLRGPGAELCANSHAEFIVVSADESDKADEDAWKFFDEMAEKMGSVWNSKYWEPKAEQTIKITIEGGCLQDVENLPAGWDYELVDLDTGDCEDDEDE